MTYAYVGSRTTRKRNARGEGISVFRVNAEDGDLECIQVSRDLVNPSYLCINNRGDRLYCVHGDGHEVSVFCISNQDGTLQFMQRQECGGLNPVHLALDPSEKFLIVSDHLGDKGGTLAVLPVMDDGRLSRVTQRVTLPGTPGPHRKEQPHAKPHFNPFDPTGRFVVVPDKGLDRIFVFRFDNGQLLPASQPWLETREGAGPRHVAFHPTKPHAYVINELDSTVLFCVLDDETGALSPVQVVSSLPENYTGNSRASEILVSNDGCTLYASNRGYDSIAVFRIAQDTGHLSLLETVPSNGKTPRFFAIAPNEKHMYVLNEDSDNIATFSIDALTGRLTPISKGVSSGSPVCLVFALAKG